jgi:hypothetical protein
VAGPDVNEMRWDAIRYRCPFGAVEGELRLTPRCTPLEADLDEPDKRPDGSQMAPYDPVIDRPISAGRIDPTRWEPRGPS